MYNLGLMNLRGLGMPKYLQKAREGFENVEPSGNVIPKEFKAELEAAEKASKK